MMKANWGPDQNTSPAVANAIILGLRARDMTGMGQPVHVNMLNGHAWTNADEYFDYEGRPPIALPDEEIHGLHALYRLYRCREGWVFLGCLFLRNGRPSATPSGGKTWRTIPASQPGRSAWLTMKPWLESFRQFSPMAPPPNGGAVSQCGVGCVQADEALEGDFYADHPHAKANALSVEVEHPFIGSTSATAAGRIFSNPGLYRTSIQVGQHTRPILREVGYSDDEIDRLGSSGIVQWADPAVGGEP